MVVECAVRFNAVVQLTKCWNGPESPLVFSYRPMGSIWAPWLCANFNVFLVAPWNMGKSLKELLGQWNSYCCGVGTLSTLYGICSFYSSAVPGQSHHHRAFQARERDDVGSIQEQRTSKTAFTTQAMCRLLCIKLWKHRAKETFALIFTIPKWNQTILHCLIAYNAVIEMLHFALILFFLFDIACLTNGMRDAVQSSTLFSLELR